MLLPQSYISLHSDTKTSDRKRHIRKEGNVLFNDALNTFYLRLYGFRHMVKDHSDSEKGNPLQPHRLLFLINSKGSFICTIPQTGLHIPRPFVTPVVEHWLEREIAQWVHPMNDRSNDPSHHVRMLLPRYISLHSDTKISDRKEGRKEMFYLTMHSTQFNGSTMKDGSDDHSRSDRKRHVELLPSGA